MSNKMRIGIITYWESFDNYGQLLQCFALQHFLKNKGYDAFLIRYSPKDKVNVFMRLKFKIKQKCNRLYCSEKERKKISQEIQNWKLYQIAMEKARERKFDFFRERYIDCTDKVYESVAELKDSPPDADVYICGSDQIWYNNLNKKNSEGWFLGFGKAKKISYAASIGRDINKEERRKLKRMLSNFSAISVRENSAKETLSLNGFFNVRVVADPTILLRGDDYLSAFNLELCNNKTERYLFVYILNFSSKEEFYWSEIQGYINELGITYKFVSSSGYLPARNYIEDYENLQLTIPEWIEGINNAECVVTSSFHGTVFCILFHKPFIVIPLKEQYSVANDRLMTLLEELKLEKRIYRPGCPFQQQMEANIDWIAVEKKLSEMKSVSENFLEESLLLQ